MTSMSLVHLFVLGLAVMRLSMLLGEEDGPWGVLEKFRYMLGVRYDENSDRYGKSMIARGIICVYCSSVWYGTILAVLYIFLPELALMLSLPLALSMFAILPKLGYN